MSRVAPGRCRSDGFTLVELLVVMAILALLIAFLMPTLRRASELARRTICMTNLKNIGTNSLMFAEDNDGMLPGRGHETTGNGHGVLSKGVLNHFYYDVKNLTQYWGGRRGIQIHGQTPNTGRIYCPSMREWGSMPRYPRAYIWNNHGSGGPTWSGYPPWGMYGKEVASPEPAWDHYYLGAPLQRFNGARQFLVVESEASTDEFHGTWNSDGTIVLGGGPDVPPWSGNFTGTRGTYAFRHLMTGNFLFFDSHVQILDPEEPLIDHKERTEIDRTF